MGWSATSIPTSGEPLTTGDRTPGPRGKHQGVQTIRPCISASGHKKAPRPSAGGAASRRARGGRFFGLPVCPLGGAGREPRGAPGTLPRWSPDPTSGRLVHCETLSGVLGSIVWCVGGQHTRVTRAGAPGAPERRHTPHQGGTTDARLSYGGGKFGVLAVAMSWETTH